MLVGQGSRVWDNPGRCLRRSAVAQRKQAKELFYLRRGYHTDLDRTRGKDVR